MSPTTFVPVPEGSPTARLLSSHNTGHNMFISHLDRSSVFMKIVTFLPPFFLYLGLTCIMVWRVLSIKSHYLPILALLNFSTSTSGSRWYWILFHGVIDFCLYAGGWPLLRGYLTGHFWLRLRWGFRATEIVFRKPTGWTRKTMDALSREKFQEEYTKALFRAVDPNIVYVETGYNTRVGFWVMEYDLVGAAYTALATGEIPEGAWDLSVWQCESAGSWKVWEVWRVHDKLTQEETVRAVKEKLHAMGRGDLVEKWRAHVRETIVGSPSQSIFKDSQATTSWFRSEGIEIDQLYKEASDDIAQMSYRGAPRYPSSLTELFWADATREA